MIIYRELYKTPERDRDGNTILSILGWITSLPQFTYIRLTVIISIFQDCNIVSVRVSELMHIDGWDRPNAPSNFW